MNNPLSLNRYSYVHNNPVNFTDPTGHWQEGDENLPPDAQEAILDLTDAYYETNDPDERQRIHQEAESIRECYSSGECGNSGGSDGGNPGNHGPTLAERIAARLSAFNQYAGISSSSMDYGSYLSLALNTTDEIQGRGSIGGLFDFDRSNNKGKEKDKSVKIACIVCGDFEEIDIERNSGVNLFKWLPRKMWEVPLIYIEDHKGYELTGKLLRHSLQDEPPDLILTNVYTTNLVRNSIEYQNFVNNVVDQANKDKSTAINVNTSLAFKSGDLFAAIHKANINLSGELKDGMWDISISVTDLFNFELTTSKDKLFGDSWKEWWANNIAAVDQLMGVIVPFNVEIKFRDSETSWMDIRR